MESSLKQRLDRMFYPKVVAVVGAKQLNNYSWLRTQSTFKDGPVYHVNIDKSEWPGAEAMGFKNFASLLDIPEPVDYVVVSVPNTAVIPVLRDCIAKGVGGTFLFTAGFGETGTEEGARLEHTFVQMAREAKMPVIGPNCMGIFHPKVGIRQFGDQYHGVEGSFGYLSQSGSQAIGFSQVARANGLLISKSVSFGNGSVVDSPDLLEYLAEDEDTKLIGMYLEGVRDWRRFSDVLREASRKKPVLVWKVGQTADAARAGQAHSGSVPIPSELWDATLLLAGAIKINSLEEMIDTARAVLCLKPSSGLRTALIAISGGHSSEMADTFSRAGLEVPPITPESFAKIEEYSTRVGGSFRNPFEGASVGQPENFAKTLGIVGQDPNIDLLVVELAAGRIQQDPNQLTQRLSVMKEVRERSSKPIAAVVTTSFPYTDNLDTLPIEQRCMEEGIACLPGMERGARALKSALDYYRRKAWLASG